MLRFLPRYFNVSLLILAIEYFFEGLRVRRSSATLGCKCSCLLQTYDVLPPIDNILHVILVTGAGSNRHLAPLPLLISVYSALARLGIRKPALYLYFEGVVARGV